ncbi:hypothetical protein GPECTOR_17g971 [Gonium pectorale]|uniref:Helicase C-terminal domain-containing protein n=1 Tax=Gonium pectorale TaxID=33097 RepID=A0A150GLY2_GONPE|nr:hypothetical protein GPECTOR_17g971 [Gonium pectorale]|eukprot:KXZ50330.1 hypothetical protein GPECTOR_17g971 [Gonium pectorale]
MDASAPRAAANAIIGAEAASEASAGQTAPGAGFLPPLRDYQAEMVEQSLDAGDCIVYMETGTGKTRVAIERILRCRSSLRQRGQLSCFLAPTVPLVKQLASLMGAVIVTPSERASLSKYIAEPKTLVELLPPPPPPQQQPSGSGTAATAVAEATNVLGEAVEMVKAVYEIAKMREVAFRRAAVIPDEGGELPAWLGDDPDAVSAKQLQHLRGQLSGLQAALQQLGPWPAAAIAAGDLFGPTAPLLPAEEAETGTAAEAAERETSDMGQHGDGSEDGEEDEDEDEGKGDNWLGVPEWQLGVLMDEGDLGSAESASLAGGEYEVKLSRAQSYVEVLSARLPPAMRAALMAAEVEAVPHGAPPGDAGSTATWGGGELLGAPRHQEHHRRPQQPPRPLEARVVSVALAAAAAALANVLVANCADRPSARAGADAALEDMSRALADGRLPPLEARDRGLLQPRAKALLALVPLEELGRQALPPSTAESGGGDAGGGAVGLVTLAVQWLLKTLLGDREQHATAGQGAQAEWAGMVFCKRKVTCLALKELLSSLPGLTPQLLRPGVLVGNSSSNLSSAALSMSAKRQEAVRVGFRDGRLNLLLSTDVGAEGLDFRQARLVAMLDPPANVTSFVQCRGRARAANSAYVLLARDLSEERDIKKLME